MIREPRDPDDDLLPLVDEEPTCAGLSPLADWRLVLAIFGIVAVVAFGLPAVLGI